MNTEICELNTTELDAVSGGMKWTPVKNDDVIDARGGQTSASASPSTSAARSAASAAPDLAWLAQGSGIGRSAARLVFKRTAACRHDARSSPVPAQQENVNEQ